MGKCPVNGYNVLNQYADKQIESVKDSLLRPIPYPYDAMLAICSDLDETPDKTDYFEMLRFLNTTENTIWGKGIGLEIGNSIYFDMPDDQFSYWNTDEHGRELLRAAVRSGHIDCLHSFGDLATSRVHAERALNELEKHNCKLQVWIDHATAPSNLDGGIMKGFGDVPESEVYHTDLTCDFGVRFIWRGRVTSMIGQNVTPCLSEIWDIRYPMTSLKTVIKEVAKRNIGLLGNKKYAIHGPNQVLKKIYLKRGQRVFEFLRFNPHYAGVSRGATLKGVREVITKRTLDTLVKKKGISILYTHLGKSGNCKKPFDLLIREPFDLMKQYVDEGKILITTTRRLLGYCNAIKSAVVNTSVKGSNIFIDLQYNGPSEDLEGLSFYSKIPEKTRITVNGTRDDNTVYNEPDNTNRNSISLAWNPLKNPF